MSNFPRIPPCPPRGNRRRGARGAIIDRAQLRLIVSDDSMKRGRLQQEPPSPRHGVSPTISDQDRDLIVDRGDALRQPCRVLGVQLLRV